MAQSICLLFPIVTNCITYSNTLTITVNQITCTACASGFYLNTGSNACIARAVTHSACTTYNPNADQCTACTATQNTFLSTATNNCVGFPSGIFQCNVYSSANVCTQCNAPYYLSNNNCLLSPTISNCNIYANNNTCSACVSNYVLVNSTSCQAANA